MVTCIFTLAKFLQKKKQKHEGMMAALHHAYRFTHFCPPYKPNSLSSAHTDCIKLSSHMTGLCCIKTSPILPGYAKVLWFWHIDTLWLECALACLRQREVRSTSFTFCTGQWLCTLGQSQRRRRSRTGKTSWKQIWKAKGLSLEASPGDALTLARWDTLWRLRHIFLMQSQCFLHTQGF